MAMLQAKTRDGAGWPSSTPGCGKRSGTGSSSSTTCARRWRTESCASSTSRWPRWPTAASSASRRLVRWEHPRRGLLLPGRFVGLAEESELIVALGSGCSRPAAPRWRGGGPCTPRPTTRSWPSTSRPGSSTGPSCCRRCARRWRRAACPPGALMLEITESGIVSDDVRLQRDARASCAEFGIRLAIDDFGTGYSSLSYLKRLPVSYMKIDRSFVMGLGSDTEDERIVAAITELGPRTRAAGHRRGGREPPAAPRGAPARLRPLPGLPAGRAAPAPRHPRLLAYRRRPAPGPEPSGGRRSDKTAARRRTLEKTAGMKAGRGGACVPPAQAPEAAPPWPLPFPASRPRRCVRRGPPLG